eukprot:scaffold5903_cov165-Ochromonas_danica.AAC.4
MMSKTELLHTTNVLLVNSKKSGQAINRLSLTEGNLRVNHDEHKIGENVIKIRRLAVETKDNKAPGWVVNEDMRSCMECGKQLHLMRRPHHCRKCGNIVCYRCCRDSIVHGMEVLGCVKVCHRCYYDGEVRRQFADKSVDAEVSRCSVQTCDQAVDTPDLLQETPWGIDEEEMERLGKENFNLRDELRESREQEALLQSSLQESQEAVGTLSKELKSSNKRFKNNISAAATQIRLLERQLTDAKKEITRLTEEKQGLMKLLLFKQPTPAQQTVHTESTIINTQLYYREEFHSSMTTNQITIERTVEEEEQANMENKSPNRISASKTSFVKTPTSAITRSDCDDYEVPDCPFECQRSPPKRDTRGIWEELIRLAEPVPSLHPSTTHPDA